MSTINLTFDTAQGSVTWSRIQDAIWNHSAQRYHVQFIRTHGLPMISINHATRTVVIQS